MLGPCPPSLPTPFSSTMVSRISVVRSELRPGISQAPSHCIILIQLLSHTDHTNAQSYLGASLSITDLTLATPSLHLLVLLL